MSACPNGLYLEGVVDYYGGGLCDVSPTIGDTNVVTALEEAFFPRFDQRPNVRVLLGVEAENPTPFGDGELWESHGFGGTEVTPAESPTIEVGDLSLVDRLYELDGRYVVLVVEPLGETT